MATTSGVGFVPRVRNQQLQFWECVKRILETFPLYSICIAVPRILLSSLMGSRENWPGMYSQCRGGPLFQNCGEGYFPPLLTFSPSFSPWREPSPSYLHSIFVPPLGNGLVSFHKVVVRSLQTGGSSPAPFFLRREYGVVAMGAGELREDLPGRCSSNRSCSALR